MAIQTFRDAETWIGAYRLTTNLHAVALGQKLDEIDATVFTDTGRRLLGGIPDHALNIEGYMDEANAGAAAEAALGEADTVFSVAPIGGAGGALTDVAYLGRALFGKFEGAVKVGDLYRFSLGGVCSPGERIVRGTLMHNATRTTSSNSTGVELGAVGAAQYVYGALHVIAASAGDTLDVTVKSSATQGGAYTTRLTFTQAAGITSEWKSAAGAITDTWWRIDWTVGGAGISFTFVVTVGIQTP
ncbi:MAG: hypothetical protein HY323_07300 [Betaproteobacteria bacterium]|nr:hypothetical protein [Betaproteobacteria bacterium]